MVDFHDWSADPRALSDCLKEWQVSINGSRVKGARELAAGHLCASDATYAGWLAGRAPNESHERLIRRMMTLVSSGVA